jgi:hypothetical protein
MNLTIEQQHLLRQIVGQYKNGVKREFLWLRSSDGNQLTYGLGNSIWINPDTDASDFECLANDKLINTGYTPGGTLRGKPTAQGIALVERDFRSEGAVASTLADEGPTPTAKPTLPIRAFVSYSTKDKLTGAAVKSILEGYDIECFLAHDDLEISAAWKDRILEELLRCDIFVPLLSAAFKASDWASQEIGVIAARNNVAVIPL